MHAFYRLLVAGRFGTGFICSFVLGLLMSSASFGQQGAGVYATGLSAPIGIEIGARGWIWVGEGGTGNNDSQVSVVTGENQVHPFITGLPSAVVAPGVTGRTNHVYFNNEGDLLIVQGFVNSDSLAASILVVDTTGFVPGSPPLGREAIKAVYEIGTFSLNEGFAETNPYSLTLGPDDDLFIVDAAANAIIRRDHNTGDLSVFATFPRVSNTTAIGPPVVDAVPSGIVFKDSLFYVAGFSGFPFGNGAANIYQVDLAGTVSVVQDSLTTVVDVTTDTDGNLVYLQHTIFTPPPPFVPHSGLLVNLGTADTLATALNRPTGLRFRDDDLFVSTLIDGEILRFSATPTSVETSSAETPQTFVLKQNYPNPFNPHTTIRFDLSQPGWVTLKVFNVLGKEIRTLVNRFQHVGSHEIVWDGKDHQDQAVAAGVYLYQLRGLEAIAQTRKMVLLK